ncbi:hypothetical protein VYU27_001644 [Nannochloropsis oceanica]
MATVSSFSSFTHEISASSSPGEESVRVVIRVRPLNEKEKQDERIIVTQANESKGEIEVQNPAALLSGRTGSESKKFSFDAVFGETSTQQQVYDMCAAPVVESVLNGFNGTIFAYGQTGYSAE